MLSTRVLRALLIAAAIAIFTKAAAYAIHYRAQPLIDLYSFRQTQTALTSFWMLRDGWHLAYVTPVGGAPWALPFEFPIYQAIVAGLSKAFDLPLDPVGRLVAFAFLTACIIPAWQLRRRLLLPAETFWIFCCLLFSAPIYVYWGRTFMMETAALFFSFSSLPYFIDMSRGPHKRRAAVFFAIWTTLSLLQKVTTGLPLLGILGLIWLASTYRTVRSERRILFSTLWIEVAAFAIPLTLSYVWTEYSSYIRAQNTLGAYLTNSNLSSWNWGTLPQRVSSELWIKTLWRRVFVQNLAGITGTLVLAAALLLRRFGIRRDLISVCVLVGLLPFFAFTNLHIVHDYYPTACVIFLLAGISLAIGQCLISENTRTRAISLALIAAFIGSNMYHFKKSYEAAARYQNRVSQVPEIALAQTLKTSTDKDAALLLYGLDWSSQVAYFSERRTFTVPDWLGESNEIWANPERFLGSSPLGAIAACNSVERPSAKQVLERFLTDNHFYGGELGNCTVLIRDAQAAHSVITTGHTSPDVGNCGAQVVSSHRFAIDNGRQSDRVLVVNASITTHPTSAPTRSHVFVALARDGVIAYSARAIPTLSVDDDETQQRFSALIDTHGSTGTYTLLVLTRNSGDIKQCAMDKPENVELTKS